MHYELGRQIGKGGMCEVFAATPHAGARASVAVKVLAAKYRTCPRSKMLFQHEIDLTPRLRHTNLVDAIASSVDPKLGRYLVLEYLEGMDLAAVTRQGGHVPPLVAAHIIARAARGLHAAHEARGEDGRSLNVVHCDISPSNIFVLARGEVKVLDFGVAESAMRKRDPSLIAGKLGYLSPEQCMGLDVDRRTDVYALGVVLYELLTGRRLRNVSSLPVAIEAIAFGPDVDRATGLDVDPALARLVLRATQRKPDDRFGSAAAFAHALERWLEIDRGRGQRAFEAWIALARGTPRVAADQIPTVILGSRPQPVYVRAAASTARSSGRRRRPAPAKRRGATVSYRPRTSGGFGSPSVAVGHNQNAAPRIAARTRTRVIRA